MFTRRSKPERLTVFVAVATNRSGCPQVLALGRTPDLATEGLFTQLLGTEQFAEFVEDGPEFRAAVREQFDLAEPQMEEVQ